MEVIFVNERGATFLQWAIMQGVAMILQNRYQRQRLYTRIALGKAKRMDVVWGETAGVDGQLWPFYPILFATKVNQDRLDKANMNKASYLKFPWISCCNCTCIVTRLSIQGDLFWQVVFCRILWFSWRFAISQTPSTL
nr:uncharacterized protein LOC113704290 isoform X2 [Coffea arabica]